MPAKIKICGINTIASVENCLENKVDFIGFVFALKSPRFITYDLANELADKIGNNALKTGLFVNPDIDEIQKALSIVELDYIQLHGQETVDDVSVIKNIFQKPIIKAVSVATREDIDNAKIFCDVADIVLFDAKAPLGATREGGNGLVFDWELLKNFSPDFSWGLAGGLNHLNVKEAIKITGAKMVDVSSGVEKTKGIKDSDLIKQFVKEVKSFD